LPVALDLSPLAPFFARRRWQEGSGASLSGPASSGERALGLDGCRCSPRWRGFYTQGKLTHTVRDAPRLIACLDEAFAGLTMPHARIAWA